MKLMIDLFLLFLIFYTAVCIFMFIRQSSFVFYPPKARHQNIELHDGETVRFERENSVLHGWLLNKSMSDDTLLIYYGGNGEDVYYAIDQFRQYSDCATLLVNYRGYNSSTGRPGEKEFFSDALHIFDTITAQYKPENIFIIGRSLGSGVASYMASKRQVSGTVLITPFYSLQSIAKTRYPFLPVSLLLKHKFLSSHFIGTTICPVLVIYGGADTIVPPENTRLLIEAIEAEKTLCYIEKAEHNTIDLFPEYTLSLHQFIEKYRQ